MITLQEYNSLRSEKSAPVNFEYKNNLYSLERVLLMKSHKDRAWYDAVLYRSHKTHEFYVRDAIEFFERFKPIREV